MLESNGAWLIVRGVGLIESVDDVKQIVIGASGGVPVYVEQVADVQVGDAFRVASLVKGTQEAVGGVVVARTGVNTQQSSTRSRRGSHRSSRACRPGVAIVPFYDRSDADRAGGRHAAHALIEEIALVTLAHVIFLMHFRSILIVTLPLPLAVLMSFLGMYYAGISSNIMSLAGIAIAIGVLVDAGIVVTENAFRFIEQRGVDPTRSPAVWADRSRVDAACRPAGVLLDGDHPAGVRAGLRADRTGRQAVSSAGVHQDVRGARGDGHRGDARAGALHACCSAARSTRRSQPGDARAARGLSAGARGALAHRV